MVALPDRVKKHKTPKGSLSVTYKQKSKIHIPKGIKNVNKYIKTHLSLIKRTSTHGKSSSIHAYRSISSVIKSRRRYKAPRILDCGAYNQLYQNSTKNGRTGTNLTKAAPGGNLKTVYNIKKGRKRITHGFTRLAAGKQGVAYLGYLDKKCTKPIAIKVSPFDLTVLPPHRQPAETEFENIQKVFQVAPQHIQAQYGAIRCVGFVSTTDFENRDSVIYDYGNQYVTFGEYYHGGSLSSWIKKIYFKLTDRDIAFMVAQILKTFARIYKKYPDFRHNDLHLGNIFVDDTDRYKVIGHKGVPRLAMADFGLATLKRKGTNSIVDRGEFEKYGIGSKSDKRFDLHFFFISLKGELMPYMSRFPQTLAFLNRVLPPGYRNMEDTYVHEWRLKYNLPVYPDLPYLPEILTDPFLRGTDVVYSPPRTLTPPRFIPVPRFVPTTAELESMRRRIMKGKRRVSTLHPGPSPAVSVSSNQGDAANIAAKIIGNMSGVTVTKTNNVRPSAANFLKMSPRSRAALKVRGARPTAKPLTFTGLAARIKTNVIAGHVRPSSGPHLSPRVYKNARFNAMVAARLKNNTRPFNNRWTEARNSVISNLTNRIRKGKPAFSPVPKKASPKPSGRFHAVSPNIRKNLKMTQTPGGRIKLLGKSGRVVYAEGSAVNKNYLVTLAKKYKVSLNNAKTKKEISKKLWGASKGKGKL